MYTIDIPGNMKAEFEVGENPKEILFNGEAMKLWSRTYEPGWEIEPV